MESHSNQSNVNLDPREARRQRRADRRAARGGTGAWIGGAMLIGLGAILLLQNLNVMVLQNWWALFILLPAVGAFSTAYYTYRTDGRLSGAARGSLLGGFVLGMVALIFLFNLNWGILGPVLLVLAGLGVLVSALLPS